MEKIDKRTKEYKATQIPTLNNLDRLAMLKAEAIPCYYARFHQPVPPGHNKEPVSEFSIKSKNKYSVEAMLYHPTAGLIFEAIDKNENHEEDITPAANVIYVRV